MEPRPGLEISTSRRAELRSIRGSAVEVTEENKRGVSESRRIGTVLTSDSFVAVEALL